MSGVFCCLLFPLCFPLLSCVRVSSVSVGVATGHMPDYPHLPPIKFVSLPIFTSVLQTLCFMLFCRRQCWRLSGCFEFFTSVVLPVRPCTDICSSCTWQCSALHQPLYHHTICSRLFRHHSTVYWHQSAIKSLSTCQPASVLPKHHKTVVVTTHASLPL